MSTNAQPDNVLRSLLITVSIFIPLTAIYVIIKYRKQLRSRVAGVEGRLATPIGLAFFTTARILVGLAGLAVLVATFLPGLMPFRDYVNQNLELGGILYLFIWPILALQCAAGFIPYSKKWITARPIVAWVILLVVAYYAISLEILALNGMYDFSNR